MLSQIEARCHRQIFGRETLSDLTAKSNAIEMKKGLQVLCNAYSRDSVTLRVPLERPTGESGRKEMGRSVSVSGKLTGDSTCCHKGARRLVYI
jgi:hypothetical protein